MYKVKQYGEAGLIGIEKGNSCSNVSVFALSAGICSSKERKMSMFSVAQHTRPHAHYQSMHTVFAVQSS